MLRASGKNGCISINGYQFGDLQDWELTISERTVETTALEDSYTHRIGLDRDCKVTARKYVSSTYGLLTGLLGTTWGPYLVRLYNGPGLTNICFEAYMYYDSATYTSPDGAQAENVNFSLADTPLGVPGW